MTPAEIDSLITDTANAIAIVRREGVQITDAQLFERARDVVQRFMDFIDEHETRMRGNLRELAAEILKLGRAHETLERAADTINDSLEELLDGLPCDRCGGRINGDGAFMRSTTHGLPRSGQVMIVCKGGDCKGDGR